MNGSKEFKQTESLVRQLSLAVVAVSLLFILNFLVLYFSSRESLIGMTQLYQVGQMSNGIRNIKQLTALLVDSIKDSEKSSPDTVREIKLQIDMQFKNYFQNADGNADLSKLLSEIRAHLEDIKQMKVEGEPENLAKSKLLVSQLSLETQDLLNRTQVLLINQTNQTFEAVYNIRYHPLIACVALTLIFLGVATYKGRQIHDHIEKSINNLLDATTIVSSGHLGYSAPIISNDELGRLTRAFNNMTQNLKESTVSKDILARANRELEAFSYSVSHDLRSPLRSVDGFSLALLEDCGDKLDDTGKLYIERIRNAIQKMGRLIDDMLDLSRLSRAEMNIATVDLSACVTSIVKELKEENPNRVVEVKIQDNVKGSADPALIRVVLQNLLSNAWKYTSKHVEAHIEFGQTMSRGQPAFYVKDDGAGFDMAHIQKLFSPFQRLHKESEFPGTGVGLATVQRIIARHKGRIWAEAATESGACFYFTLDETVLPTSNPRELQEVG